MRACKTNSFATLAASGRFRYRPLVRTTLSVLALMLLLPTPSLAVQIHGAPEGLYVHMMAHLFFSAALVFLLCILQRRPPSKSSAWRFLKLSLFFFLLWNIDTLIIHWLSLRLPDNAFITDNALWLHRLRGPMDFERWLYFFGRFDHLLCLPAMWFLALSLNKFCLEAEQRHSQPDGAAP